MDEKQTSNELKSIFQSISGVFCTLRTFGENVTNNSFIDVEASFFQLCSGVLQVNIFSQISNQSGASV